ncbi:MAG: four helix bundle protein [Candidatus Doudnabacteria bacterium]|nr:four helix bundle protein [Candidatus Doudnabacteria bacterium]
MTNNENPNSRKYDLEERTAKFGEEVIRFCSAMAKNDITRPLINQLVRCGTATGANYCEADDAESKADFKHKIGICKKESRECKHFLRMIKVAVPEMAERADKLWTEAKELNLIFNAIYKNAIYKKVK